MRISYDTNIAKAFGVPFKAGPRVGIELEYESADAGKLYNNNGFLTRWKTTDDPSLRAGGIEFISLPTKPEHIEMALEQVKKAMSITGAKATKRCGVHVHLNVTDLTFRELWNVAVYYTLLEPFIFKEFADGREDSHFCVPTWANTALQQSMYRDATVLHRGVQKIVGGSKLQPSLGEMAMGIGGHPVLSNKRHTVPLYLLGNAKYSAMNFTPLEQFGTVEFRQHGATVDMRKVQRWCEFLLRLRTAALAYTDAEAIMNQFDEDGFLTLCETMEITQSPDVNPNDIEDAVDAASLIVGHQPTDHHDLNWEIK